MSELIKELRSPIPEYTKGPNEGEVLVNTRPPTAIMLRAARELEKLVNILTNQDATFNTLRSQLEQSIDEITKLKEQLCALQSTLKSTENLQPGEPTVPQETTA